MFGTKSTTRGTLDAVMDATPASVGEARRAVSAIAAAHGAPARDLERIALAVSEAMTNAVEHAYGAKPAEVHVTASMSDGELSVLVADDGCGLGSAAASPGLGLGLGMIEFSCDSLTITQRAGGGTLVEMYFRLREREARSESARGVPAQARGSLASATSPA